MFKVGDKVFENERAYGEGVVTSIDTNGWIYVFFENGTIQSYTSKGMWSSIEPITLFKKEEKMKNYYYVGQKVSHQALGDGVVESITSVIEDYPIFVNFKNCSYCFTFDGRLQKNQLPSLSQKPHVSIELEEVISFEKGELVWVKNANWDVRYYSHLDGKKHYFFVNQQKDGYTMSVEEVRKFSDNPLI